MNLLTGGNANRYCDAGVLERVGGGRGARGRQDFRASHVELHRQAVAVPAVVDNQLLQVVKLHVGVLERQLSAKSQKKGGGGGVW